MKKFLLRAVVLISALSLLLCAASLCLTSAETEGDYEYEVATEYDYESDTYVPVSAAITAYFGGGGDIAIPATLGGLPVTGIGTHAFSDCTSLTSVKIPDSVTDIDWYAFSGCTSLTSVEIPDSVTTIGSYAFDGCTSLTSVSIGNGVTTIEDCAFSGCMALTAITVDSGNSFYCDIDGVLFNKDKTELIQYLGGLKGEYGDL